MAVALNGIKRTMMKWVSEKTLCSFTDSRVASAGSSYLHFTNWVEKKTEKVAMVWQSGNYNFCSVIKRARGKSCELPGLTSPRKEMKEFKE